VGNSLLYLGLFATLVLTVLITRFASGALEQQLGTSDSSSDNTQESQK
jgi:hypothetical protein